MKTGKVIQDLKRRNARLSLDCLAYKNDASEALKVAAEGLRDASKAIEQQEAAKAAYVRAIAQLKEARSALATERKLSTALIEAMQKRGLR